jgi:hypothetical protein
MAALDTITITQPNQLATGSAVASAAKFLTVECTDWKGAVVRVRAKLPDSATYIDISEKVGVRKERFVDNNLLPLSKDLPSGTIFQVEEIAGRKPGSTISVIIH